MTERAPITHELKCWLPYFQEVYLGRKNFEVRINDRDYRAMDILKLREFDPAIYEAARLRFMGLGYSRDQAAFEASAEAHTGRECERMVGYVLYGGDPAIVGMEAAHSGIAPGYVVMSLVSTPRAMADKRAAYEGARPEKPPLKSARHPGSVRDDPQLDRR